MMIKANMTYEEFVTAYTTIFNRAMSYKPSECGFTVYAEKMADFADAYPEFADRAENETLSAQTNGATAPERTSWKKLLK